MSRRDNGPNKRSRSYSRSRSHSRSRQTSPFDAMTSDPRTLDARVFVGSLQGVSETMLKNHFSKYGDVKGVLITKRKFGFIQFSNETESAKCLADGPIAEVDGHWLDVKPAKIRKPGEDDAPPSKMSRGASGRDGGRAGDSSRGAGYDRGGRRPPIARRRECDDRDQDYYGDSYYRDHGAGSRNYSDDYSDYYRDYYDRYYREGHVADPPPVRDYPAYASAPVESRDALDLQRPNDVEIVVPNKAQRDYAESIERELRSFGLLVDVLFPPADVPSARVLSDLASRRCLYAVFITPDNEKHRSMTINILYGTPQEHRNMPIDDAMLLMQRDFEEYVKQSRRRISRDVVPRDIRILLLDLLESRPLPMVDLEKMIKYLKDRQNMLVDDHSEIKRDPAGLNSSTGGGHPEPPMQDRSMMAVTYPGYNYGGAASTSAGENASRNMATAPVSYPGFGNTNSSARPMGASPATTRDQPPNHQQHVQYPTVGYPSLAGGRGAVSSEARSDMQLGLLDTMKNDGGASSSGQGHGFGGNSAPLPPSHHPVGVPPPVPAPSGVPPPPSSSHMSAMASYYGAHQQQPGMDKLSGAYAGQRW